MTYVTVSDMQALYREELLVQATNFSDRVATLINNEVLAGACSHGNGIVDGYLIPLGLEDSAYTTRFLQSLKIHAARLAMDHLISGDETIRTQAEESIKYLESLKDLVGKDSGTGSSLEPIVPAISYNEGRRWSVTF